MQPVESTTTVSNLPATVSCDLIIATCEGRYCHMLSALARFVVPGAALCSDAFSVRQQRVWRQRHPGRGRSLCEDGLGASTITRLEWSSGQSTSPPPARSRADQDHAHRRNGRPLNSCTPTAVKRGQNQTTVRLIVAGIQQTVDVLGDSPFQRRDSRKCSARTKPSTSSAPSRARELRRP